MIPEFYVLSRIVNSNLTVSFSPKFFTEQANVIDLPDDPVNRVSASENWPLTSPG